MNEWHHARIPVLRIAAGPALTVHFRYLGGHEGRVSGHPDRAVPPESTQVELQFVFVAGGDEERDNILTLLSDKAEAMILDAATEWVDFERRCGRLP